MTDRELREFKEWFEVEWAKITKELKVYNLSKVRLVASKEFYSLPTK